MDILKKEIVAENSPMWIGFQHALLAGVSIFIFSFALSITWMDVFGFYFSTVRQDILLTVSGTLLGTLFSAVILFRISKKAENPQGILKASVLWFTIFHVALLFIFFVSSGSGTHYGKTATDNLLETLPLTLIMIVGFSLLSWLFLKKRKI
ncbi:MAG: hypothetical protein Q8P17_04945 [bacterium]|nr:hypothetical protein [bacterium]